MRRDFDRRTRTALIAGLLALIMVVACRNHISISVLQIAPRTAGATGTVSGTVRGPERSAAVDDRTVEIVNIETNERQRATTNHAGGFSFRLSPGRYRVEIALREGEAVVKEPGVINITDTAVDAKADFIVGTGRISRPRGPAYRIFDGLGHPIT